MRRILPASFLALAALTAIGLDAYSYACGNYNNPPALLRAADGSILPQTISDLRRAGPAGLRTILAEYDRTSDAKLIPSINAVAAQHDAQWSRLYWYTDLEAAKSAAAAEHKPILALRMLGNLTDEYSCANSRFFRTALYANENVSRILRDKYILVWTSERPVPVVTIDYGDGRVLKRTITGNSIHYILNSRGDVIDALPGLYDPQTFAAILTNAMTPATSRTPESIWSYRQTALAALDTDWIAITASPRGYGESPALNASHASRLSQAKNKVETTLFMSNTLVPSAPALHAGQAAKITESNMGIERPLLNFAVPAIPPHAATAMRAASGKSAGESPVMNAFLPPPPAQPDALDSDAWATLATGRPAMLDQHSIAMIRSLNPAAYVNPAKLDQVVSNFQNALAIDTLRDNQLFRRQILNLLLVGTFSLEALNTYVYSNLFLTPRSDPWLGLVPDSIYSALSNDGCSVN